MFGALGIDTYLPSFLAIGEDFNVSQVLVQQTLSLYLFAFSFLMLFYGTLSDSFGRRPVILWSLAIFILASFGAALVTSFSGLLVCRVLQGLAAGGGAVVSRAIVRDRVSVVDAQKMLAYMMMVFSVAPAVAPILGGWLHVAFGWRSIFVFLGVFGSIVWLATVLALPESLPPEARHRFHLATIAQNYWKVLKHPKFLLLSLAIGIASIGFSLYIGSAAQFIMNILHLPETAFGWMFIPLVGGTMAGSVLAARFASRFPARRVIYYGYAIMAVGVVWNVAYNAFFTASVPWAVLPLAMYSFGLSIASPALTVMVLEIFPKNRGLAASLQSFVQMMIFALISGFVAPLIFQSAFRLACGVAVGFVLSFLVMKIGGLTREPIKP